MATKKSKAAGSESNGKRKHRAPDVVIAEMEARLARAKLRLENKEHRDTPAVKAIFGARNGLRRLTSVEDPEKIFDKNMLQAAVELLEQLDEAAMKFGARDMGEKEEAA